MPKWDQNVAELSQHLPREFVERETSTFTINLRVRCCCTVLSLLRCPVVAAVRHAGGGQGTFTLPEVMMIFQTEPRFNSRVEHRRDPRTGVAINLLQASTHTQFIPHSTTAV
jgi:hypothetical protein